jgi:hypothetical protein
LYQPAWNHVETLLIFAGIAGGQGNAYTINHKSETRAIFSSAGIYTLNQTP